MATLLYRLGRFSFRRAWLVIGVWSALLVAIVGGGFALGGQSQESFEIPGTESQEALDRLAAVFPSVAGAAVQVVAVAPEGESVEDGKYASAIEKQVAALAEIDGVDTVLSPFSEYAGFSISDDASMALTKVQFDGPSTDVTDESIEAVLATASIAEDAGMTVEFGGQVLQDNTPAITVTEGLGVIFAAVVLVITFGSLLAAGMPLLSALIGVGIVIGGITGVSAFTTVSSSAPLLALMIGLAVGIDYSLFILSRHRHQLAMGEDPQESAATAVGTAGSAVVFAGVTVIIALLGLLVVEIPFLSVMGVGAAVAVFVAILIAITLLPAFLGLAQRRLAPKLGSRAHRRALAAHAASTTDGRSDGTDAAANDGTPPLIPRARPSFGLRWVKLVMKAPLVAVFGVIAILGTLAIPALSLDLNLPDGGSEPAGSTARAAYDLTTQGFGPGFNGPLIVAVDITQTTDILGDLDAIGDELRALPDVDYVSQGIPDPGLDTAIIQVIPSSAPDAIETKQLVQAIRERGPEIADRFGTPIFVTGSTAVGIDISNRLTDALIPFGLIVVGLSIILLMMVFRSVLVPVKAALGFLLSVTASFGVVVAVFQWGWLAELVHVDNPGPILSFMPIILMAVLFGLAMDYEVFLVSGMREEFVKTGDARFAVEHGFANGARVVTAAALIMFFVFFAFVPEGSGTIKPIALGLAVGIAFDAFLVRMTLVPALMTLFGRAAWWMPAWLGRALPDMDIEGEKLRAHLADLSWVESRETTALTAEYVTLGTPDHRVGPLTVSLPVGGVLVVSGPVADRRLFAATVAGRLDPLGGRLQVAGHPLPSERATVVRRVALADIDGGERDGATVTIGELLRERIALAGTPGRRGTEAVTEHTLSRVNEALARATRERALPVRADSAPESLPPLERAVALAAVALAEGAPVVVLDQVDTFSDTSDETAFLSAVAGLASPGAAIVVGTPMPGRAIPGTEVAGRALVMLDLYSIAGKDAVR